MAQWILSGRAVDAALVLMLVEGLALWILRQRSGRGLAAFELVPSLLAGGCLLGALRAALTDAAWPWIALALTGALVAHVLDMQQRLRRRPGSPVKDRAVRPI